jgi:glucose/arabinose dehydrogenase
MTPNGTVLYASNPEAVYSWTYDPRQGRLTSSNRSIITGMSTEDHTTRTLLLSQKANGTLVVTRGSTSNIDAEAESISSGHSQVKSFNLDNQTDTYDFNRDGRLLGWGLRNDVGVAEEPTSGGIYTVENSVDQMMRDGVDVHQNNPGEELNFLGYLNGTTYDKQGANFGYPSCFSAWNTASIPSNQTLEVGSPFAIGDQNATLNDTTCADTAAARLTFQAHMAPLDIKFNPAGSIAWITFHGSWDRTDPSGYKLSAVEFANGSPVEPSNSTTALIDIMSNPDNSKCPDDCFRPVGLAFDSKGRLFMSSDATGEIWMITQQSGDGVASATPTGPPTSSSTTGGSATTSGGGPSPSTPSGGTRRWFASWSALWVAVVLALLMI